MSETDLFSERDFTEPNEDENDLPALSEEVASQAIVNATDWTVETILSQIKKGNILLNPKFQRRDAWRDKRKSEFIESLFLGLPIPQIVLASHPTQKGKYLIIDGKQRLLSLRKFDSLANDPDYPPLKLTGLSIRTDLNNQTLESIRSSVGLSPEVSAFENETIRTVVIRNWPNESFLYRVFLRLNTNSVGLSPQELRQALLPGEFIDYADNASAASMAIQEILNITKPDFRMRDVEIFIRYMAFKFAFNEYAGSMKSFLDAACSKFNSDWDQLEGKIKRAASELEQAHVTVKHVFSDGAYAKWLGGKFERKPNRAIFDIMAFYFSIPEIRIAVSGKESKVLDAFKNLCMNDRDFMAAIERTTKSMEATQRRFYRWAEVLELAIGVSVPKPSIIDGRLSF